MTDADLLRRLAEWWSWTERGQPVHAHIPTEASEDRCGMCGFYSDDMLHREQRDE